VRENNFRKDRMVSSQCWTLLPLDIIASFCSWWDGFAVEELLCHGCCNNN